MGNRALVALAGAAGAAILLALWIHPPGADGSYWPACPFHALTGLFCPGCGSTRALHALLHGELAVAWSMNPLLMLLLPVLPLMAARAAGWQSGRIARAVASLGDARPWAVLVVGYFILRNIPAWPFEALAPG